MSVRKNFRFDDFTGALLEEISVFLDKPQTLVIEQLVRDHVIYHMTALEGKELMKRASEKISKPKS